MQNQRDLQRYIELCKIKKVASVDVFGTLIQRVVANDTDLYTLVGKYLETEGFNFTKYQGYASLRENAQKNAADSEEAGEVTLDAIYERLKAMTDFSNEDIQHFKSVEVEYHHKVTYADPGMLAVVNKLRESHIPVIIISDMYLPASVIESMLSNVGYGKFDRVFVSCELHANKHSGTIFRKVLEKMRLSAKDIVHIGDSRRGDFLEPHLHGIKAVLYRSAYAPCNRQWFTRFAQMSLSVEKNVLPLAQRFGYIYGGPAFASMMQWIENQIRARSLNDLYFLSREGNFLQQCWKEWGSFSINTHYLHVSRKSTLLPSLYVQSQRTGKSFSDLVQSTLTNRLLTVNQLLNELGIKSEEEATICEKYSVKKEQIISRPFPRNIGAMIDEVASRTTHKNYQLLLEYLEQEGLGDTPSAIVDVGWKATMQIALQRILLGAGYESRLTGFYCGLSKESPLSSAQAVGCFFNKDEGQVNEELLTGFRELFETLCMPNEGTTLSYFRHGDLVIPKLRNNENSANDRKTIDAYQQGILSFIRDFRHSVYRDIAISAHESFHVLAQELYNPDKQLLRLFASINTYDHGEVVPVAQRLPLQMLVNPHKIMKNFLDSPWRVGWIALNIPTRNPGRFYLRLRKII